MNKILCTACIIFGIHTCASAQYQNVFAGNTEVGLEFFIDSAYANSPVIKDNQNKLKYSELSLKQSVAELASPKVFLASEVLFAPYLNNGANIITAYPSEKAIGYDVGITNGGLYSATANASLPLITVAGKKAYHDVYSAETESYNNQVELTKHEIEQTVTYQYVTCYLSELQIDYVQRAIKLLEDQKAIVKDLVNSGISKQSDYILMGIEIQNQQINLSQFQSDYSTAFLQLKTYCGIKDSSIQKIALPAIPIRQLNNNSKFLRIYKTDSMQIIASQHVFNLKYKPALNLYANGGLNAVELPGIQSKFGVSAGLNFNWMIYDGKQKRMEQQKDALLLNTSETYKMSFLKQHELKKQNALKEISNLDKIMFQKKQQMAGFEQLLQLYKVQFGQGQISVIDYLNTVKNYIELQRDIALSEANKLLIINEYNYLNW
jgi:outer membrane protein TolC